MIIFLKIDSSENRAQLLEEEVNKTFGTNYLHDAHDCNVVTMNSLDIQNANDDCTSHDDDVSYKNVNFCGINWECTRTPIREDRFCKKHKYLETKKLQERLDDCAERFKFFPPSL